MNEFVNILTDKLLSNVYGQFWILFMDIFLTVLIIVSKNNLFRFYEYLIGLFALQLNYSELVYSRLIYISSLR